MMQLGMLFIYSNLALTASLTVPSHNNRNSIYRRPTSLFLDSNDSTIEPSSKFEVDDKFDLDTALFCAGLAFDAYVEPPEDSSRWERGSKGMNVAFCSSAFTRNLYKGMVEVTPLSCSGLPEEDDNVEAMMTGSGVDACILVAAVEGQWKEDIELLKQEYHEGIMDLTGAAHVGRSSTAWSNVNESKSNAEKKKSGKAPAYHVAKSWGKDASAVWPEEEPFYIYIQDPSKCQLLFTVFDDDVIGDGSAIGSTYTPLTKVLPQAKYSQEELIAKIKAEIVEKIKRGELDANKIDEAISNAVQDDVAPWEGDLKLTSKPRIKNKNSQVAVGMAAGAMVAGPVGAALGAAVGGLYEGQIKGRINLRLRYLPIPQANAARERYNVLGGMPGINWGELYKKYLSRRSGYQEDDDITASLSAATKDLEFCFFINHDTTGGCCAVYRSLEKKLIVVSFRGTCKPVDLLTDASIVQEPWIQGEDMEADDVACVHVGFRKSMNSISRRLKELVLACVGDPKTETIEDYDMLVTGHSLGGALATLFVADIGEFGIDAGRALPQTQASDMWWKALTNTFRKGDGYSEAPDPPRPKSLRLYNFGSPRVGNKAFASRFRKALDEGKINQAYRMVNDKDVVARAPRTMVTLSVDYDHCGSTVLVQDLEEGNNERLLWVEGESDDSACPVRDYEKRLASPTAEGSLLGDLLALTKGDNSIDEEISSNNFGNIAAKFQKRLASISAADVTSVIGIDKSFTERELQIAKALYSGDALAHHMEDSYYAAMGRASGFVAVAGDQIEPVPE